MIRSLVCGAAVACAMAALAGCGNSGSSSSDWTKPGASAADMQRDLQDCKAQAASLSPRVYDQRTQQVQVDELDVMQRQTTCMLVGGWRMTPRQ